MHGNLSDVALSFMRNRCSGCNGCKGWMHTELRDADLTGRLEECSKPMIWSASEVTELNLIFSKNVEIFLFLHSLRSAIYQAIVNQAYRNTTTMAIELPSSIYGFSLQACSMAAAGVFLFCLLAYRWALPKPIPGIPYNKEAVNSLFGDINSMVQHTGKTQEMYDWMTAQNVKLNSPIIQLFVRPFGKPWVVIADYREAHDIMVRRTKEFDRSKFFGDVSGGISPKSHFCMPTNSEFKQHRKWVQGVMGMGFLHETAAPHMYEAGVDLLKLWEQKSRLAKGHPFAAAEDIYRTAMDAVWAIVFGADPDNSTTKAQLKLYAGITSVDLPDDLDKEAELEAAPYPDAVQSFLTLTQSVETSIKSPVPVLAHWVLRQTPTLKKAYRDKDQLIGDEIEKAMKRLQDRSKGNKVVTCAIDDFVQREIALADKEKRTPEPSGRGMYDEVCTPDM